MDRFVINGPNVLKGKTGVDGSKNAALPIIAGALLVDRGETVLKNVPPLRDIYTMKQMLEYLGANVTFDARARVMTINAENLTQNTAPYELMRQMRASFLVLGPLLSRLGEARISLPGGCSIGARPVDYHIKAFAGLGAKIRQDGGYVIARGKPLRGTSVYFDRPSHTGTENVLFGAVFARSKTTITNAACDPEIIDVAEFLNSAGAKISGFGTPTIVVEPVKKLRAVEYSVSGDRLVAGTIMIGTAMTGGKVEISGFDPGHLTMVNHKLMEMGCSINLRKRGLTVIGPKRPAPARIAAFPYPGFPTDLQACMMAAASISSGTSHIVDTVYPDRFSHTMELKRLGANIAVTGSEAVINGVDRLRGAEVMAGDIRGGAGITLACLVAAGRSEVARVYHIDRAYSRLEEKLAALGADIKRITA
jgi:UDP-N-acetylglucosamine 1-carboxyvinyltransferase